MLSILISFAVGALTFLSTYQGTDHLGWSSLAGMVGFCAALIVLSRIFGRKLKERFDKVQQTLETAREEANKVAMRVQGRGKGMSPKLLQKKIEKQMAEAVDESIKILDDAKPLYKWTILADRQVATFKMQLFFQNKKFEEVDELLPKALYFDPMSYAMKMTREYQKKDMDAVAKTFKKASKKFKGEKAALVYSTYAWMLVKQKDLDKALEVLKEAKEKTANEEIERNWQAIANNKPNQFSNNFLGEQWYALHLEKPKQSRARVSKGEMRRDPRIGKVSRKMR